MRRKILSKNFFNHPAEKVAEGLLGKFLVRRLRGKNIAVMIVETEAYVGPQDKASHASRRPASPAGRRTARNEPMFGEAGIFYVYFTYGMHWMLNVVTGKKDYPAAVLLRAGKLQMANGKWQNIDGPARLTKFLKIDKRFNGKSANPSTRLRAGRRTGLWLEDRGIKIKPSQIKRGPRIGVDYAGRWAKKPYNFKIKKIRI